MAKVKINDLDAATTPLDGTELVEIEQAGQSAQCTTQSIADLAGAPYLKYVALLTQQNEDAPTAAVLENTLGGTVVWTRNNAGDYAGTLAGVFTENKTGLFIGNTNSYFSYAYRIDANSVGVQTMNDSAALSDSRLIETMVEIRVYP